MPRRLHPACQGRPRLNFLDSATQQTRNEATILLIIKEEDNKSRSRRFEEDGEERHAECSLRDGDLDSETELSPGDSQRRIVA